MAPLSTSDVAKAVGIARSTLEAWISQGKVRPRTFQAGRMTYRVWTQQDVRRLRRVKELTYCKGRGRKPKRRKG